MNDKQDNEMNDSELFANSDFLRNLANEFLEADDASDESTAPADENDQQTMTTWLSSDDIERTASKATANLALDQTDLDQLAAQTESALGQEAPAGDEDDGISVTRWLAVGDFPTDPNKPEAPPEMPDVKESPSLKSLHNWLSDKPAATQEESSAEEPVEATEEESNKPPSVTRWLQDGLLPNAPAPPPADLPPTIQLDQETLDQITNKYQKDNDADEQSPAGTLSPQLISLRDWLGTKTNEPSEAADAQESDASESPDQPSFRQPSTGPTSLTSWLNDAPPLLTEHPEEDVETPPILPPTTRLTPDEQRTIDKTKAPPKGAHQEIPDWLREIEAEHDADPPAADDVAIAAFSEIIEPDLLEIEANGAAKDDGNFAESDEPFQKLHDTAPLTAPNTLADDPAPEPGSAANHDDEFGLEALVAWETDIEEAQPADTPHGEIDVAAMARDFDDVTEELEAEDALSEPTGIEPRELPESFLTVAEVKETLAPPEPPKTIDALISAIDAEMEQLFGEAEPEVEEEVEPAGNQTIATTQHIIFTLNNVDYGIPISQVVEISRMLPTTRIPGVASWLQGVANIRGDIVTVVDLRHFLGMPLLPVNNETRMLIVRDANRRVTTGLIVDRIREIVELVDNAVETSTTEPIDPRALPYLSGIYHLGQRVVTLMDLELLIANPAFWALEPQ